MRHSIGACVVADRLRLNHPAESGFAAGWISTHLFCDLPDDECAGSCSAGTGASSIQVSPVLGARRAGAVATFRL
jgi:hypothetical protein